MLSDHRIKLSKDDLMRCSAALTGMYPFTVLRRLVHSTQERFRCLEHGLHRLEGMNRIVQGLLHFADSSSDRL